MVTQQQVSDSTTQPTKGAFANPGFSQQWTCLEPTLDEESTEADDIGAFASLLSGSASEVDTKSPETDAVAPLLLEHALPEEPEQSSDLVQDVEKNQMVCRHWKTKGFCRLESNCKFLHPAEKRGIAATNLCCGSGISRAACPGMSTGDSEMPVAALARRKKRGGKNRSNKRMPVDVQDGVVSQFSGYVVESN
jgi:hypothetical protein